MCRGSLGGATGGIASAYDVYGAQRAAAVIAELI